MAPPTCGLAMPLTPPRPRAASPAKSLVDSQSWSITVNSTQAPRRRHASAGTELWTGQSGACCSHPAQAEGRAGQAGTHKWKSSSYTGCSVRALTWVLWLRTSGKRCGGPSSTITKGSLRPRRYLVSQMSPCPQTPIHPQLQLPHHWHPEAVSPPHAAPPQLAAARLLHNDTGQSGAQTGSAPETSVGKASGKSQ